MVCRDVPPSVQSFQISEPTMIGRIRRHQVERDTETVEFLPEMVPVRVTPIQGDVCRDLRLNHDLQCGCQGPGDDLGALRAEVSTESLEMGTQ
jgi:hypothetical protein